MTPTKPGYYLISNALGPIRVARRTDDPLPWFIDSMSCPLDQETMAKIFRPCEFVRLVPEWVPQYANMQKRRLERTEDLVLSKASPACRLGGCDGAGVIDGLCMSHAGVPPVDYVVRDGKPEATVELRTTQADIEAGTHDT